MELKIRTILLLQIKKLILTIFENRVKNSNLPFFLKLMNHSKKFGVKCPEPLKDKKKILLIS